MLNCGNYFADLLNYHDAKAFEILAFHLYTDSLKKIYADEIPYFIKKPDNKEFIYKVASVDVIRKFVESLYFYFDNPGLVNDELLKLKIKELILLLMQTSNAQSIMALFSNLFTPRLLNVKDVVNSHLFSDLSINDLAKLCNLSVSTFNRTFQDMFDDTPASYIKTKRLERAKELLLVSSLSVSEIAFQTCFNDAAHFSRSFKTAYTCSPTEFRLLQKTGKA
nr:AraC family transcriptional regulator [Mucilaginibacter ginsenosidivorans]